jgi:hypothetical protein
MQDNCSYLAFASKYRNRGRRRFGGRVPRELLNWTSGRERGRIPLLTIALNTEGMYVQSLPIPRIGRRETGVGSSALKSSEWSGFITLDEWTTESRHQFRKGTDISLANFGVSLP